MRPSTNLGLGEGLLIHAAVIIIIIIDSGDGGGGGGGSGSGTTTNKVDEIWKSMVAMIHILRISFAKYSESRLPCLPCSGSWPGPGCVRIKSSQQLC